MNKFIKTEFIKEKRSANSKLIKIVPLIFIIFTSLVVLLMVRSIENKSYLLAAAYNWYPILILPIILSLLVVNIIVKEKDYHINLYKSL
ncbi:ABC transporter permease, partial [Anaerococcus sp.]